MEYDHRDLIPPLGAMDFSTAKQKKPPCRSGMIGMKVCSIMADRDGRQGQPYDGGTRRDGVRRQTADPADILAAYSHRSGRSSTEHPFSQDLQGKTMCLDAGFPGETVSGHGLFPGCTGRRSALFREKTGVQAGDRRRWRA